MQEEGLTLAEKDTALNVTSGICVLLWKPHSNSLGQLLFLLPSPSTAISVRHLFSRPQFSAAPTPLVCVQGGKENVPGPHRHLLGHWD